MIQVLAQVSLFLCVISLSAFAEDTKQNSMAENNLTLEESSMAAVNESLAAKTIQKLPENGSEIQINKVDKTEKDIPLQLEHNKKDIQDGSSLFRILFSFSVFGVLLTGAFYFFKNKVKTGQDIKKTQIRVLTQHYLGPKKSLAIIRVAGESILIGVTDNNINLIKSLSLLDEELPIETPQNFAHVIGKLNQQDFAEDVVNSADEVDEFSIKGIKDVVAKKLKNMRNLE